MLSAFFLLGAGYSWGVLIGGSISSQNLYARVQISRWPLVVLGLSLTFGSLTTSGPEYAIVALPIGLLIGGYIGFQTYRFK